MVPFSGKYNDVQNVLQSKSLLFLEIIIMISEIIFLINDDSLKAMMNVSDE